MTSFPLWAAIRTIKSRVGTWIGYETYRALDPTITREDWASAIGQARASLAAGLLESVQPLNRRPDPSSVTKVDSARATGYVQYVKVYVRDRETGFVSEAWWSTRSDTLRSRQSVVNAAWSRFQAAALPEGTFEGEQILGVDYSGTVEWVPRGQ